MIISFNPVVFQSQDTEIQETLADILVALMKANHHFIDIKSVSAIFYNQNMEYIFDSNTIVQKYFSLQQRRGFKELLNKKSQTTITSLYKQHLRYIVIGINEDKNEIHPSNAYRIITERSKIIVENGINDWKFITGICQKYSGCKKRRSIYELLNKAIKDEIIESENCGGIGEIIKVTERWVNSERYQNIYKYKLMAIFDSDRCESNGFITPHDSKIKFFKQTQKIDINQPSDYEYESTDLIIWHILYKRKIENYVSLDMLFTNVKEITLEQKNNLLSKTHEELDFIEYSQDNIGIGKSSIKQRFPEMFIDKFLYHEFETRCNHHNFFLVEAKENVSEIEQILLKMAKII